MAAVNSFVRSDTELLKPARRTPGRPRGFDPDAVLRTVADRFRDGGFSATSLDDLVRATRINRPSLYAAFGDKRGLYVATLDALVSDLGVAFDAVDTANTGLRGRIVHLFARSIDSYLSGPSGPRGCLAVGTASAEAVADPAIRAALDRVLALIDERLARWFAIEGDPHPARKARLLASILHSLSIRARAGQPRAILEEIAEDALGLLAPVAGQSR